MSPKTTLAMMQILRDALPEIPELRRVDLHIALVRAIGRSEAQHLPVERLAAGVQAWFGVERVDIRNDILIMRMREALIAATGMRETTIEEDLRNLMRRAEAEDRIVTVREVAGWPLAQGNRISEARIEQASPSLIAYRRELEG